MVPMAPDALALKQIGEPVTWRNLTFRYDFVAALGLINNEFTDLYTFRR